MNSKQNYSNEFRQMVKDHDVLTREWNLFLSKRSEHSELYQVKDEVDQIEKRFEAYRNDIAVSLEKNKTLVSTLRDLIAKEKSRSTMSVDQLRQELEKIETSIYEFKEHEATKFDALAKTETLLSQEIESMSKRFDSWSKPSSLSVRKPVSKSLKQESKMPPEVQEFDDFLVKTGGYSGGWDDIDHQTFLRFRSKFSDKSHFLLEVSPHLPTKHDFEIEQHAEWFQRFTELNERRKAAIERWKMQKRLEKDAELRKAAVEDAPVTDVSEDPEKRNLEQIEKRKALNAWKVQKELDRLREEEQLRREEEERQKKAVDMRRDQLQRRREVSEFQRQKAEREEFLRMEARAEKLSELQNRKQETSRHSSRIQARNEVMVQHRLSRKQRLQAEKERKEQFLESVRPTVVVRRDRDRLLQPTSGWCEKVRANTEQKSNSAASFINQVSHRAVPSWRQGMN